MLGEWAVGEDSDRSEQASDSFGVHDEGAQVVFGVRVGLEIGDVVTNPFSRGFVPPDLFAVRIPRLAFQVAGSAVIEDAAIGRPGPSPIGIDAHAGGILGAATLDLRSGFGP